MYRLLCLPLLLVLSLNAFADASLNYGLTTRYIQRGIYQTGDDLVLTGGADVDKWGFYAGAWAYHGNFENNNYFGYDLYGGYRFNIGGLSLGAGYISYNHDDNRDADSEYTASASYGSYRITGYWDEAEQYRYYEAAANYQFWEKSGFVFTAGHLDDNATGGQVWDYSAAFVAAMPSNVDIELKVTRQDNLLNLFTLGISRKLDF